MVPRLLCFLAGCASVAPSTVNVTFPPGTNEQTTQKGARNGRTKRTGTGSARGGRGEPANAGVDAGSRQDGHEDGRSRRADHRRADGSQSTRDERVHGPLDGDVAGDVAALHANATDDAGCAPREP